MTSTNNLDALGTTDPEAIQNQNTMDVDTPTRLRPGTQAQWEKQCPKCEQWIGLGVKGSTHPFLLHLDGGRCRRAAELKARNEEALGITVASTSLEPPPAPASPLIPSDLYTLAPEPTPDCRSYSHPVLSSTQPNPFRSDVLMAVASPPSSPLTSLPSLILPERMLSISPDPMELDMFQVSSNPPSTSPSLLPIAPLQGQAPGLGFPAATKVLCRGVRLKWECGHSSKTYPFQYHDTDNPTWSVTTRRPPDPDVIYLQSFSCTLFHDVSMEACFECLKIPSSNKFQSLVLKASRDPAPTVPWGYLSWEQISKRLKDRTDECRRYRKKVGSTPPPQTQC